MLALLSGSAPVIGASRAFKGCGGCKGLHSDETWFREPR